MLVQRNLNEVRGGMRTLAPSTYGVLGSTVPVTGQGGRPALAYNDVITNALSAEGVGVWVTSHNFPAGFFVWPDSSWGTPPLSNGAYIAYGYLQVNGADVGGAPVILLELDIGSTLNVAAALTISSVPSMVAAAVLAASITAVASLTISSTPSLSAQAVSQQTISAAASLTLTCTPTIAVQAVMGEQMQVEVTLDVSCVPSMNAHVNVGFELPDSISASRIATVDLDSDATHPAAVFVKDPQATLDYAMDITSWLADAQDALLSFSVTPTVGSDVVVYGTGIVRELMAAMVGGGTVGASNAILFDFTTVGGRHDQRTIYFQIEER